MKEKLFFQFFSQKKGPQSLDFSMFSSQLLSIPFRTLKCLKCFIRIKHFNKFLDVLTLANY